MAAIGFYTDNGINAAWQKPDDEYVKQYGDNVRTQKTIMPKKATYGRLLLFWFNQFKMLIGARRGNAPSRRSLNKTLLDQKWF